MIERAQSFEITLSVHSRGTGSFCDVRVALLAWELRRGYRDESGMVLRHPWKSLASTEVAEIAQKTRQRRARA
jgi:hypothetical protein